MTSTPIGMTNIYVVRSDSGKVYDVSVDRFDGWYCTCADYLHRGQYLPIPTCKHCKAKQVELLAKEIAATVKAPAPVGRTRLEQIF